MLQDDLQHRYFEWLYHLVCGDDEYNRLSYRKLLSFLHSVEFTYIIDFDENRAQDGIDFRYHFGLVHGYPQDLIDECLGHMPCSVLEMMIALAFKVEEEIMCSNNHGDRTGQWFWNMVVSLGLGYMNDNDFNEYAAYRVISNFLERNYSPDGRGGLFTIENCPYDLRTVQIWSQFMCYLNTQI